MNDRKDKIERLSKVARMYYEDDQTQGEIADVLHVSRPLVSRMLREARDIGIVEIRVRQTSVQAVCPLIGNSSVSSRNYHTDENVRIIAGGMCAQPKFLYTPAFAADEQERSLLCNTSHYRSISAQWDKLDMALVGIHEFSAVDDADRARIPDAVTAGHMVAYAFDVNGRMIRPEADCAIHIPLDKLSNCRQVIGLCAADVSPRALAGALRTGLLTHVFARESLVDAVMADEWNYA